jgi:hypothetical protein
MGSRLKDKVALIVGAGSVGPGWGNGRATTVRFVEEGARVFGVDVSEANLRGTVEKAPSIKTHIGDVMDSKSIAAMVKACLDAYGRIDILVNNVGGSAPGGPVEMSEEVWDRQIDYNLKSVFLTCKHVLPVMERQGGGAIVNLSSTSGVRYSGSPHIAYVAAKAGIRQFSQAVAAQYAPKGSTRATSPSTARRSRLTPGIRTSRWCWRRAGSSSRTICPRRRSTRPRGSKRSAS